MARVNKKALKSKAALLPLEAPTKTHGGAEGFTPHARQELRRAMVCSLLFEDAHYEGGEAVADRIRKLALELPSKTINEVIMETKFDGKLRHMPLFLASIVPDKVTKETLTAIFTRPDNITDFLALYWKDGKKPLKRRMKAAINAALNNYDAYKLGKYKGSKGDAIKLVDVFNLTHPKPKDQVTANLWRTFMKGELKAPDTWEVALSAGKDKKETFERLIKEEMLGYLALLRNLRNMKEAGVDKQLVRQALLQEGNGKDWVLPFRYVAAARACPEFEPELDAAMLSSLKTATKLKGSTLVVIDISGSMGAVLSAKSDMNRKDAAMALGAILREQCQSATIYATAGDDGSRRHATALVPARRGMALVEGINGMNAKLGGGGIFLKQVCDYITKDQKGQTFDRMVVITDEQDCDNGSENAPSKAKPLGKTFNYMLNVGNSDKSIAFKQWVSISGFSEKVVDFILEYEKMEGL